MRYRLAALPLLAALTHAAAIPENKVWKRPTIPPLPAATAGIRTPVVSLRDADWKITTSPATEFWLNSFDISSWRPVRVPASVDKQGIRASRTGPFVYKTRFTVPADFAGKRTYLRFDGVTGTAVAWVNGVKAGEHHGGFTVWNSDITPHITPGKESWLTVSVVEPQANQSSNGYGGGIIRDVKLFGVPTDHITRFHIETDLDTAYRDATLKVWVAATFAAEARSEVRLTLKNARGQSVALNPARIVLTRESPETIAEIPVLNPVKWDAEHPNLYRLEASLWINGRAVETVARSIGFREVQVSGRRLLVNGKPVKLRGTAGEF